MRLIFRELSIIINFQLVTDTAAEGDDRIWSHSFSELNISIIVIIHWVVHWVNLFNRDRLWLTIESPTHEYICISRRGVVRSLSIIALARLDAIGIQVTLQAFPYTIDIVLRISILSQLFCIILSSHSKRFTPRNDEFGFLENRQKVSQLTCSDKPECSLRALMRRGPSKLVNLPFSYCLKVFYSSFLSPFLLFLRPSLRRSLECTSLLGWQQPWPMLRI